MRHGPTLHADGSVEFTLWAPAADEVTLVLKDAHLSEAHRRVPMERGGRGFHVVRTGIATHGTRYAFAVQDAQYPDPASRHQPDGVHEPSAVVDFSMVEWADAGFEPPALSSQVIYELHVGTFTPEGTFAAAARRLSDLASLGVTTVEVMPIAEFAGGRNWGYDGVYLYAAQSSYGGPLEFARFVNAAHQAGLSVLLDVVFNHFGPEGNYTGEYAQFTSHRYRSPWGAAVNLDGPGSDQVRSFFHGCLEHWIRDCHVDGFRLDAVHEIHDESAVPFLSQLTEHVEALSRELGKNHVVIAESDLNDRRVVLPREKGGWGMDAAWADDFHHAMHAWLTGERNGYYADFGSPAQIANALTRGWCYAWDYSRARGRHHGNDPSGLPTSAFVFCTQNHDQVGNRMLGERLPALAGAAADRAARVVLLLAPYVPLLFMGQEYGEDRPFLYFVDHTDQGLLQATREGRAQEFAAFHRDGTPPDPGARSTRDESVLAWPRRAYAGLGGIDQPPGGTRHETGVHVTGATAPEATSWDATAELRLTRTLLDLRRRYDCFRPAPAGDPQVTRHAEVTDGVLNMATRGGTDSGMVLVNLSGATRHVTPATIPFVDRLQVERGGRGSRREASGTVVLTLPGGETAPALHLNAPVTLAPWGALVAVWEEGGYQSHR